MEPDALTCERVDPATLTEDASGKIACAICRARVHVMESHLSSAHGGVSIETYKADHPGAPIASKRALAMVEEKRAAAASATSTAAPVAGLGTSVSYAGGFTTSRAVFAEIFELGAAKAARNWKGEDIPINVFTAPADIAEFVPTRDKSYVWSIDLLKRLMLGLEINMPIFLWGHSGVGKSTIVEQICSVTGRPMIRGQHTANTEESHVLGGWRVRDGSTHYELGPLPFAMKYGLVYLADEYDFGMPQVLAVYQPVLEGKALVIKEADSANRVIQPHPMFRFVATGNTNGAGDETGLYQGTNQQNAANFERFGMVEEVRYPAREVEISIVAGQAVIPPTEAEKLVKFAEVIREAFNNGKMSAPVSPRALINAAKIGKRVNSLVQGLHNSFINRLPRVDQETAREFLKRTGMT